MFSWMTRCWRDNVSYEGGLSLLWMDGLLLIPFVMAAFFYHLDAFLAAPAVLADSLAL